jgi:formamidopyrimidine-DNA glycosylase
MPELPDILLYMHALEPRIVGERLLRFQVLTPFVLRTVDPSMDAFEGRSVEALRRVGKRIVLDFGDELFIVIHLMIAGRLRWDEPKPSHSDAAAQVGSPIRGLSRSSGLPEPKITAAAWRFNTGTLRLTEAGTKKRASIHLVRGEESLKSLDPGGIDVLTCALDEFIATLRRQNRTLKRALTDPASFSGIGNAYSDEIFHAARISPITLTAKLTDAAAATLLDAARSTLLHWTRKLQQDFGDRFPGPGDVTAFRPDFAVHGRFKKPCPVCGAPIQRVVRADNEWNYCPRCQTGGEVLADRSLSRLLKDDWPRTVEELEG